VYPRPAAERERPPPGVWALAPCLFVICALLGCDGPQSALDPASPDAERVARLFWWMAGGAAVVWSAMAVLAFACIRVDPARHRERAARALIIGGGAAVPTVVLGALLSQGLAAMPELLALPPPGGLVIAVEGEQWWWRVRYHPRDSEAAAFELANEIWLPVGERIELRLSSPDVIHSFWVPSLAGKMDMIPGRVTRLALEPARSGRYRGACAEYCGASHAFMNFDVVVVERPELETWMARQAMPALEPATAAAVRGRQLFVANGCGACHAVRGTAADGVVGPDLTHVGGRSSLAGDTLPRDVAALGRWIASADRIKPGSHMPGFGMLSADEIEALAAYLDGLR
jgi:cytochrome c oxidase subunit 2